MYLFNLFKEMVSQRQFLIRLSIRSMPRLHSLDGQCPEFPRHFFRGRQRLLHIRFYCQFQEFLKVCNEEGSEMMGPAEELADHLEGRETDFCMLLIQLGHNEVVEMIDVFVGNSVNTKH